MMNGVREQYKEREQMLYELAWLINLAGSTDSKGKPIYRTFKQFYKEKTQDTKIERYKEFMRKKNG